MVAVVLFAMVFAAGLAVLLARYATNPAIARAEAADLGAGADRRPRISPATLRGLVVELLGALGYEVVEEEVAGEARRLVAAQRAVLGGSSMVVFIEPSPAGDAVGQETVVELAEQVKATRAAVGLLVTPYAIDTAGLAGLEVPIEILDGARLRELIAAQLPRRLSELERYRGFGVSSASPVEPTLAPKPV